MNPAEADIVLLVLDGHYSHTRSLDVINFGLRASCFSNFLATSFDAQDVAYWLKLHVKFQHTLCLKYWTVDTDNGRDVTVYQVAELFGWT